MNQVHLGTAHLSDEALVAEFESCRLPTAHFHHADHIRLAWIFLGKMDEAEATRRIELAIRRYAEHNGIGQKYHHTITLAWMKLVAAARRATPGAVSFDEFAEQHPELLAVKNLNNYYTPERLARPEARSGWLEPDIGPLPWSGPVL
jgi:hypothetical protein